MNDMSDMIMRGKYDAKVVTDFGFVPKRDDQISRAAAISEIDEYLQGLDSCISEPDLKLDGYRNGLQVAIQELKALPAVDAIPVEWLRKKMQECDPEESKAAWRVFKMWQKEQEAR